VMFLAYRKVIGSVERAGMLHDCIWSDLGTRWPFKQGRSPC
jgi:hypothetical protein